MSGGRDEAALPHLTGDSGISCVRNSNAPENLTTPPPVSSFAIARFSVQSHTSQIDAGEIATLFLAQHVDGYLHADYSGARHEAHIRPGTLTFAPWDVTQAYDFSGTTTNTVLSIQKSVFETVVASDVGFASADVVDARIAWSRPSLQRMVEDTYANMTGAEAGWQVLAEANALRIAVELLRVFFGEPKQQTAGVLTDAEVDRVLAFIESALGVDFDLSAMARVLDRDVFSFTRAFKAATGETPHRFVIGRRIDRAQQMLRYGTEPLADIAYACGFSSQAHMTSTFTKHAGISPGRYRKEVRS